MAKHTPRFLEIVNEARKTHSQTTVETSRASCTWRQVPVIDVREETSSPRTICREPCTGQKGIIDGTSKRASHPAPPLIPLLRRRFSQRSGRDNYRKWDTRKSSRWMRHSASGGRRGTRWFRGKGLAEPRPVRAGLVIGGTRYSSR